MNVYIADVSPLKNADIFNGVYSSVSEIRRAKTDRLRFEKDRRLSLGVECLLMRACHDYGINYEKELITVDSFMKPKFANLPIFFNLSHSEERVMCVMSCHQVGCDVEKITPMDYEIAEKYFSKPEFESLESCETEADWENAFFRYWTLKESFLKCTGLGFRISPDEFSISIGQSGITIEQNAAPGSYRFDEAYLKDGYWYAWCVNTLGIENYTDESQFSIVDLSEFG